MSTDMSMPLTLAQPAAEKNIKALKPAVAMGRLAHVPANKPSNVALAVVVLVHVLVFLVLLNVPKPEPLLENLSVPMTVNLISAPAPEPEVVPLIPTPPKPQPVVKKQKQQPREVKPTPQPIETTPTQTVEETAPTPPTPAPEAVVAKAPEVKPEPEKPQVKEDVIEEPRYGVAYLNNPAPNYPALSRRLKEQGQVLMRVLVSANGDAESVTIKNGSGSSRLDQASLEAVKKWRFIPAKKNKQPISAYIVFPINFSLDND